MVLSQVIAAMHLWSDIATNISAATGKPFHCRQQQANGGGCINGAFTVSNNQQRYFVKLNSARLIDMFEAEAAGLNQIAASNSIHVPAVICAGISGDQSYLVLQHLSFGHADSRSHQQLGLDLAQMHSHCKQQFGWQRDNTIGLTPQHNKQGSDWVEFWRTERLAFQLQLAASNGYCGHLQRLGEQLLADLDLFFTGYSPTAALLHGDLWSGNYAFGADGCPIIFDPAVYYGDRETDIAMTELFGGFNSYFYQAYQETFSLDDGYPVRKTLYNLYHVLNHLNLFGGGYLSQAESMLGHLLSEIR